MDRHQGLYATASMPHQQMQQHSQNSSMRANYIILEQSAQAYSSQIYSGRDLEMETMIEVTIEKSGKILDVALKPELPEKDMERALCLIVKRVGLFPPIPRQFKNKELYSASRYVSIANRGSLRIDYSMA